MYEGEFENGNHYCESRRDFHFSIMLILVIISLSYSLKGKGTAMENIRMRMGIVIKDNFTVGKKRERVFGILNLAVAYILGILVKEKCLVKVCMIANTTYKCLY